MKTAFTRLASLALLTATMLSASAAGSEPVVKYVPQPSALSKSQLLAEPSASPAEIIQAAVTFVVSDAGAVAEVQRPENQLLDPPEPKVLVKLLPYEREDDRSELIKKIVGEPMVIKLVRAPERLPGQAIDEGDQIESVLNAPESNFAEPILADSILDDAASGEVEGGFKPISSLTVNIGPTEGELPPDPGAAMFAKYGEQFQGMGANREWVGSVYEWEAPALAHGPLRFEDVNLERYGYHHGLAQPLYSAAHFFGRIPVIPYMWGTHGPGERMYTLGYYRPGSYAPYQLSRPQLSVKGALLEAGAVVGVGFLLP